MAGLADIIRTDHAEIIRLWTDEARRAAAARGLGQPAFQNIIPVYLSSLADAGADLGLFSGRRRALIESHLASRIRQGFSLAEIVEEIALLGRCIATRRQDRAREDRPRPDEIERLFAELQAASVAVSEMFTRHMMEDEQVEKQFIRLIQSVATEALQEGAPPLRERLKEVLDLVLQAMGAQSTVLLLYNPETEDLDVAASVGLVGEQVEEYASSLGLASFADQVAQSEESTEIHGASMTEWELPESIRQSGLRSILGVRLTPGHKLLGVMLVGLVESRAFTAREVRRLESLGEHLTLHLDNAKLYADLRANNELLRAERELRSRFVSVLAHDLRGPLQAAKMGAHLLSEHPERLDVRRDLADKVERSIDRTDRMIRDLLDANLIRSGHPLPLRIEEFDLAALARSVFEELVAVFGDRFELEADDSVVGYWSPDDLRRALWNLATNAIKYGAEDRAVTLSVHRPPVAGGRADASVHNWGKAIPREEQKRLFRPFSRTHAALMAGVKGWGLGLTLVNGTAQAHGGQVRVESTPERGTTFVLELPLDSRPFQPTAEETSAGGEPTAHPA